MTLMISDFFILSTAEEHALDSCVPGTIMKNANSPPVAGDIACRVWSAAGTQVCTLLGCNSMEQKYIALQLCQMCVRSNILPCPTQYWAPNTSSVRQGQMSNVLSRKSWNVIPRGI
jgi:hypothetical protein